MKIALLGDLALTGIYDVTESPDVYRKIEDVASFLSQFDYVVGNLETPFTNQRRSLTCKAIHLRSAVSNVDILKYLHINVVNLANNHIYDYGRKGYRENKQVLNDHEISYIGIEGKSLLIEKNGDKVALSGYCCYSSNPSGLISKTSKIGINIFDLNTARKKLREYDEKGYYNIISLHFGDENIHYPRKIHRDIARAIARDVPYILYGHHPHVLQGIEKYQESLLAYSLGNFCFDDVASWSVPGLTVKQSEKNNRSIILTLNIQKQRLVDYQIVPICNEKGYICLTKDNAIIEFIREISEKMNMDADLYEAFRQVVLNQLKTEQREKRDFIWYRSRLNYYWVGSFFEGLLNSTKIKKTLKLM